MIAISTCKKGQQGVRSLKQYECTYGLVHLLLVTKAVLGVILNSCAEQRVYEGGFSKATLSNNHDGESGTSVG